MFDRGYPNVSYEFERRFKNAIDKYGIIPACWSGYADPQRFTGRFVTEEEQMEYIKKQIDAAAQLGFPILRIQPCRPFFKLVPYAEKKNVKLTFELHAPMDPVTFPMIQTIVKMDTPYVGFVPDCGAFCRAPSEVYYKRFSQQGVPQETDDRITEMWKAGCSQEEIRASVRNNGPKKELIDLMATEAIEYFGRADPAALVPLMKHIPHVHGKFFHVNDKGVESAVRISEIVAALRAGGFNGYMACEYEGHHWFAEHDVLEQLTRHQALVKRCFAEG
jgi:hypothetical protein